MPLSVSPLSPSLGAAIGAFPFDGDLDEERASALRDALHHYGLLLIRGVEMTPEDQVRLGRALGELEDHPFPDMLHPDHPEIVVLAWDGGGDAGDATARAGEIPWHTDLTYLPTPSSGAVLRAIEVPPEGGETAWISTVQSYEALPRDVQQQIEGLEVVHDIGAGRPLTRDETASYARTGRSEEPEEGEAWRADYPPPVVQPLVWSHPVTGRRILNISPLLTVSIVGFEPDESERLLSFLKRFATRTELAYRHCWQPGDVMIWDNWQTMHSVTSFRAHHRRVMHRVTLAGDHETGRYLDPTAAPPPLPSAG